MAFNLFETKKPQSPSQPGSKPITGESLFGRSDHKPAADQPIPGPLFEQLSSLSRRIKLLEDRFSNIKRQATVTDQNMLEDSRNIQTQMNMLVDDVNDLRKQVKDVYEKIALFSNELEHTAKKSDVNTLMKYLMMWEPMNFVTEKEAREMIRQALDDSSKNTK